MLLPMNRFIVSLASTLLALSLVACGGSAPSEEPHHSADVTAGSEQPLVAPGEAGIGDRSTCPVSGGEFVVTESSPSVEHEGRTYYFCCPGCAGRFEANPEQYLEAAGDDDAAADDVTD
jgi:YHS domain-containing protein